jgi:hypothetical protein
VAGCAAGLELKLARPSTIDDAVDTESDLRDDWHEGDEGGRDIYVIGNMEGNPGLAVSPGGRQILYTQIDQDSSDLKMVSFQ